VRDRDRGTHVRPRHRPEQEDRRAGGGDGGARLAPAQPPGGAGVSARGRTLLTVAGVLLALARPARAADDPPVRFRSTVPPAIAAMTAAGRAPADMPIEPITVFFGLRDAADADAIIAA